MEIRNLPFLIRPADFLLQPRDLLRAQVVGFEREEPDILLRRFERVIRLAFHVERRVSRLRAVVVIAKRGVELHTSIEQRLVGILELPLHVLRPLATIDVVADGDHQLVGKARPQVGHLLRELVLPAVASAEVAKDGELERILAVRELDPRPCLGGGSQFRAADQSEG